MLGTIFVMVSVVALTATVTEQTKCYTSTSLGMVDPEIIAVNHNRQKIFYTCSTRPHTSNDKNYQSAASYVKGKTTSYERVHTVIVDIVY